MDALDKIRNNQFLSVLVALILGIGLYYAYSFARVAVMRIFIWIGGSLIEPFSEYTWLLTTALNIIYSAVAGLAASVVILTLMFVVLRPNSYFLPQVTVIPFIILSYWWFISDVAGFLQVAMPEQVLTTLLSHLGAILVWLLSSWLLVNRKALNQQLQPSAEGCG